MTKKHHKLSAMRRVLNWLNSPPDFIMNAVYRAFF